jgi:rRNA maturation endonuclease Nob1
MPGHEEHCLHSEKRYGVRGDDIHSWIDEPVAVAGASHRDYRHDLRSLPTAIQIFGPKYGADLVENIFLDHLKADSEENRKKEVERSHIEEKITIRTFPISPFDSAIDGLGRYLESTATSVPKSPRELINNLKRIICYHSYYEIDYSVDQAFKTSIGQIHHEFVNHGRMLLGLREPEIADFLGFNEILFAKPHEDSDGKIVSHEVVNPREYALKQVKALHSKQVSYSSHASSRRYTKFCEISERNIRINSLHLVYLPIIKLDFKLLRTSYAITIAQKTNGEILQIERQGIWGDCLCNACGKLFHEGGSIENMEGFRCSKCGHTTCRKDGHWRKKHILFKEFVCPKCYEEGKNSGISYSEFD